VYSLLLNKQDSLQERVKSYKEPTIDIYSLLLLSFVLPIERKNNVSEGYTNACTIPWVL